MFCTQCGKENRENSTYCFACGAALSAGIAEPIARESEREGEPDQTNKNFEIEAMDRYFDVLKKYATFSGRARRKEFWMFLLLHFIIVVILLFVDSALDILERFNYIVVPAGVMFTLLYILGTFLPYLAVSVRRLHDTNRSGWWLLFLTIVPIVGGIVFIVFMATAGHPGENKYGPNPKVTVAAIEGKSL